MKKKIIFNGKIDEIRMTSKDKKELDKTKNFSIEAWVSMNKRDNLDIIGLSQYTYYLPYWYPLEMWCHNVVVVEKKKKEVRYFDGLEVCKENWEKILNIIFKPIRTWNKPAQYTLALSLK